MMKYNIKIKKILFLSLVAIIFCLPVEKSLAGVDTCSGIGGVMGVCQSWCSSDISVKDPQGSLECAEENYVQNTCCVPNDTSGTVTAPVATDSMTSCADASGRKGNCEFGACSEGLDPAPIQSTDCWLGRNCCAPKVEAKPIASASSSSSLPANTGISSSPPYQNPSLIKCAGGKGLCYNNSKNVEGSGCPSGISSITDTYSDCGTANICCGTTASKSCGEGGLCVDEQVICTNTTTGSCEKGQKCCIEKISRSATNTTNDPVTVKASSPVAYNSQCDSNNKNCKTDNDRIILANQCQNLFTAAECVSMPIYLDSLTNKCLQMKPAGISCEMISNGGFYGNEASKFANYYIQNSGGSGANSGQGAGGLDFDSIAATGIPDSPNVKVVLVNIVKWMLEIIGLITFIAFIISGGQYLLASGDDKMIETAKKNMTYSVIGIIVALSGFVIIRAIDTALRATSSMF